MNSSIFLRQLGNWWLAGAIVLGCQQTVVATPAVVGLWRFDEGSGTTALDSSGLGNHGTLVGQNGAMPAWVTGKPGFGGALYFTNNSLDYSYVQIPAANSLMVGQTKTNQWSITAWAYEDSGGTGYYIATYGRILDIADGEVFQFCSGAWNDPQVYTWARADLGWQIGWGDFAGLTPLFDQWVHWAIVYDGVNLKLYRNGNQGESGGFGSHPVAAVLKAKGHPGTITIGTELMQAADHNWNGMLDDIAVFSGALTEAEIVTVMNGDFAPFINGPVRIVRQPESMSAVRKGASIICEVGAAGEPALQYQWLFNGRPLSDPDNSTITNATLILPNAEPRHSGIYSVRISNAQGSVVSQPTTVIVMDQPLVGLWQFEEGSGLRVRDSSGLGNDGELVGEHGNLPARAEGQAGFGGALRFTNNWTDRAYVSIPENDSLMIGLTKTNPWTVTAWAYEDSNGTGGFVATYGRILVIEDGWAFQFSSGAGGDPQFYTWSRIGNLGWQMGWGEFPDLSPLFDQWVHWAVVYNGAELTIYRNGNKGPLGGMAAIPVVEALGGYFQYNDRILIGSELAQPADHTWNGLLDEIAVFDAALTPAEIETVMVGEYASFLSRPNLSMTAEADWVRLAWPAVQFNYQLQSAPRLDSEWSDVLTEPALIDSALVVVLPRDETQSFFRLIRR
ncbi:MAG: immunoglobulin domain-containing protein [Verrucomicrobiae bacterium]|nr:immunoglobulin domain-containing protein [Verrucomicrobiae bacterium]